MLHQATEHTCIAVIKACIDYRASTHNLSKLLALTENFTPYPSWVFPQISEDEIALFKLLLCAYSDVRYCENFSMPMEKAKILRQRIKDLQRIAEALYYDKIREIKNQYRI